MFLPVAALSRPWLHLEGGHSDFGSWGCADNGTDYRTLSTLSVCRLFPSSPRRSLPVFSHWHLYHCRVNVLLTPTLLPALKLRLDPPTSITRERYFGQVPFHLAISTKYDTRLSLQRSQSTRSLTLCRSGSFDCLVPAFRSFIQSSAMTS